MEKHERALLLITGVCSAAVVSTAGWLLKTLIDQEKQNLEKSAPQSKQQPTRPAEGPAFQAGDVFYSNAAKRWHVCAPDGENGLFHIIPLDETDPDGDENAAQQAIAFICAASPEKKDHVEQGSQAHIYFQQNRWMLWHPCQNCGGCSVVLSDEDGEEAEISVRLAAGHYEQALADNPDECAGCIARRLSDPDYEYEQPAVWYDPEELSWQLSIPTKTDGLVIKISLALPSVLVDPEDLHSAVAQIFKDM